MPFEFAFTRLHFYAFAPLCLLEGVDYKMQIAMKRLYSSIVVMIQQPILTLYFIEKGREVRQ